MLRSMIRNVAVLAALGLAAPQAQAGFSGTFALEGFGSAVTGDSLGTATTYTIPTLLAGAQGQGGFSGVPQFAAFSGGSFTLGTATGFSFSSPTYGTFTETAAPVVGTVTISNGVVTARSFYILGLYTGGAVGTPGAPASFTVSFTQDGGPGTSISSSGTLTIPPAPVVPEPASVAMLGLGLAAVGGYGLRRRTAK